jgi:hypothetical protein
VTSWAPRTSARQARRERYGVDIERPAEVPWSVLGPEWVDVYARSDKGEFTGEHAELTGQSGSGKSYTLATMMQDYTRRYQTGSLIVVTKNQDDSLPRLGWPVVESIDQLRDYRWALFWPRTKLQGAEREKYHEQRLYELLTGLWHEDANILLAFDEVGYIESLSHRMRKQIRMMWREARSHKIAMAAMKQRPIGVSRDQHSETRWKIVFPPADEGDMQRFAELLGPAPAWSPILRSLDQTAHQFVIRNTFTGESYISWIDRDLRALPHQAPGAQRKSTTERLYGE